MVKDEFNLSNFLDINFDVNEYFSYSSFSSGKKLIRLLKIKNNYFVDFENLKISIYLDNKNILKIDNVFVDNFYKESVLEILNFNYIYDEEYLKNIKIEEKHKITVEIENDEKEVIGIMVKEITFLPFNFFSNRFYEYEILSLFVSPNDFYTKNIVSICKHNLEKTYDYNDFLAYKSSFNGDINKEINIIYRTFSLLDFNFVNSINLSFENGFRIRKVEETFLGRRGTELDLAILISSAFEYLGFSPILIFNKNRVYMGIWSDSSSFYSPINNNIDNIKNFVNIDKILIFDLNKLIKKIPLDNNLLETKEVIYKTKENLFALDIKRCRKNGYFPISNLSNQYQKNNLEDIDLNANFIKEEYYKTGDKFSLWEKKLLDISKNNRLINMKIGSNNFQLLTFSIFDFNYLISDSEKSITLFYKSNDDLPSSSKRKIIHSGDFKKDQIRAKEFLLKNKIEVLLNEKEYFVSLNNLIKASKQDDEENGVNTLFLCFGIFSFKENIKAKNEYYAPIFLYPIEIFKDKNKLYKIKSLNQEPIINTSLIEYLKDEFNLDLDLNLEIPYLKENEDVVDLNAIFNEFKKILKENSSFSIYEEAFIGRFSFSKFIMRNDIKTKKEEISKNKIIKSFLNGRKEINKNGEIGSNDLENISIYKDLALPLPYDSTQLKAILSANNKESFVMIGPPGTGKSQTIANIIINSIYNGKKVLFCSEKKAALDVVYNKLENLKLDTFALEIHSNKQDKKIVLDNLNETLTFGNVAKNKNFLNLIYNINENEEELKNIVILMNKKGSFDLSLLEAISRYEKFDSFIKEIIIENELFDSFDIKKLSELNRILNKLSKLEILFLPFKNNPLKIYDNTFYSIDFKNDLSLLLASTINSIDNLLENNDSLLKLNRLDLTNISTIEKLFNVFTFIKNNETNTYLLKSSFDESHLKRLKEMVIKEEEFYKQRGNLILIFDKNLDLLNGEELLFEYKKIQNMSLIKKTFALNKLIGTLKKNSISPKYINSSSLENVVVSLNNYKLEKSEVKKNSLILKSYFKDDYDEKNEINYEKIINIIDNTIELNKNLLSLKNERFKEKELIDIIEYLLKNNEKAVENLSDNFLLLKNNLSTLESKFNFDFIQIENSSSLNNLSSELSYIYQNIDLLNEYSEFNSSIKKVEELTNNLLIDLYKNGESFENIYKIFNKSFYKAIINNLIKENKLDKFIGLNYDEIRKSYNELDKKYKELIINEVASKLSNDIPSAYSSSISSSEVGILKKAIKSDGRGLSLRKIFSLIPNILLKIKPVVLSSPLSIVKYLDSSLYHFDIVIFDESSQLPTYEAIPIIYRGDSVIIAGDDKQLPPTSFFERSVDESNDLYHADLDSILDDSISLSFDIEKLSYHYRSKNESLIAFSNNKFYNNSLFTFPSSDDKEFKVYLTKVNGIYDLGRTSTNKIEASKLIDDLCEDILKSNNETFGIVAFSIHQMELLDELLAKKIESNIELEEKIKSLKEPIFIKNLENVQGDERDVIYLSICYGKDKNGRFVQNFGPINNDGGYRRLNVAISRSRTRMHVYSSISYLDINLGKTNSEGVKYLKDFLEYAEFGVKTLNNGLSLNVNKDGIGNSLAKDLKERGYEVEISLGSGKFKIDLGVVSPKNKNKYILGIILDSYNYSSIPTTKDRNIIEFNELYSLGWNIKMVWSLDYLNNKEKVLKEIDEEINKILLNNKEKEEIKVNYKEVKFEKVKKEEKSLKAQYLSFNLKNYYNESQYLNAKNREQIFNIIKNIIEVESPISESYLILRIYKLFQINRKNKENTKVTLYYLSKLNNPKNKGFNDETFYFNNNNFEFKVEFYRQNAERKIEDIAKEETANAIKEVLFNEISVEKENLKKVVTSKLGFKSKTIKIDNYLDYVLRYLLENNEIKVNKIGYFELNEN